MRSLFSNSAYVLCTKANSISTAIIRTRKCADVSSCKLGDLLSWEMALCGQRKSDTQSEPKMIASQPTSALRYPTEEAVVGMFNAATIVVLVIVFFLNEF